MAVVRLEPPFEDIMLEYPVVSPDSDEPAVRITNTRTGESEDWFGPYAQSLGRSLQLAKEGLDEDLEESQDQ